MGTPRADLRWQRTVKLNHTSTQSQVPTLLGAVLLLAVSTGCSFFPETRQRDRIHNPFPQMKRVAILPFYNQSTEPTVNGDLVAEKYYAALQAIPGFEVLPIGVTKAQWMQYTLVHGEPRSGEDFQQLAKQLGVEALVVGSVTDFDAYYPPRMAMTVHWYTANEGFHPIPAGYGLPWGTKNEKQIPKRIAREAEFELARSQLATQTPLTDTLFPPTPTEVGAINKPKLKPVSGQIVLTEPANEIVTESANVFHDPETGMPLEDGIAEAGGFYGMDMSAPLPQDWPDPTDLIPDPPAMERPVPTVNHDPVLSHTRLYQGDDPYFTNRLSDYVETGDDARPGGWQGYLKRSDDFVHFCCHLHVTEMLESRGGSEQSDLILRWPLSRY